jgi:hypothetical protein
VPVYRIPFAAIEVPAGDYMEIDLRVDSRPAARRGESRRVRRQTLRAAWSLR